MAIRSEGRVESDPTLYDDLGAAYDAAGSDLVVVRLDGLRRWIVVDALTAAVCSEAYGWVVES